MPTPKSYISYSQLVLFERSPELYAEQYIYGKKQRISRNIALGSAMADGLEFEESTGDPLLDLMASRLPKFELMDKPIEAVLEYKKEKISLLAKPDSCKKDMTAFKEYKTSVRKWSQKMVDDSCQITFYAMVMWLKTGKIPKDIELVCVKTAYSEQGQLSVTGDMYSYKTSRNGADIAKLSARIYNAWQGIKQLCEKELLT